MVITTKEEMKKAILEDAYTKDQTDALKKAEASFNSEHILTYESYFNQIKTILYKMQYSIYHKYIPSSEQLRFIMTDAKYVAVDAAPGSGKTATLTVRTMYQKETHNWKGKDMLLLSFTNNSAEDMERQYNMLCRMFGVTMDTSYKTIHKFGKDLIRLLSPYTQLLTDEEPIEQMEYDEEIQESKAIKYSMQDILRTSLKLANINKEGEREIITPSQFYNAISVIAEKMITSDKDFRESSEDYSDFPVTYEQLQEARKIYQLRKKQLSCIDFIDMLETIHGLLVQLPSLDVIAQAAVKDYLTYKAIYVDEVQDVSPLQIAIIKELLRLNPDCKLTVVGDGDQSIYGFRGADPSFLLDFVDNFMPDIPEEIGIDDEGEIEYSVVEPRQHVTEIIYMTTNRRSAKQIINVGNKLIKHNKFRYDKVMRPRRTEEGEVKLVMDMHNMISTGLILNTLKQKQQEGIGALSKVAIIYREHKQCLGILNKLVNARIPLNCAYDKDSAFFACNNPVVEDIRGIIRLGEDMQNPQLIAQYLYKFCPSITRQNGEAIAEQIRQFKENVKLNPALSTKVLKLSTIMKQNALWNRDIPLLSDLYALLNDNTQIDVVVKVVFEKYKAAYFDRRCADSPQLNDYVQPAMEYFGCAGDMPYKSFVFYDSETKKWIRDNTRVNNGVRMITFHASKGLEFDETFILKISDAVTPKTNILEKYSEAGRIKYIEEERRLLYVAITRAKFKANIFFDPENADNLFIKEIRDALTEIAQEQAEQAAQVEPFSPEQAQQQAQQQAQVLPKPKPSKTIAFEPEAIPIGATDHIDFGNKGN